MLAFKFLLSFLLVDGASDEINGGMSNRWCGRCLVIGIEGALMILVVCNGVCDKVSPLGSYWLELENGGICMMCEEVLPTKKGRVVCESVGWLRVCEEDGWRVGIISVMWCGSWMNMNGDVCWGGNVENEERVRRRERKGSLHKGELSWGMEEDEEEGHAILITHLHHHHFSHTLSPSFTLQPHQHTHPTLSRQLPRSSPFS
ncbi:hypothetical protein V8G54_004558 [Vigna mungo]|uniref:Uncharacterized protein n=1 Tax=Vigna mungo TaxID=3915 RepID=A0AAQ3SFZ7_VIGMU